jgi:hypothetical protein
MRKIIAILVCFVSASAFGQGSGAEPKELAGLRRFYDARKVAAVRPILIEYKQALQNLENTMMQRKDLAGANAVHQEITAVSAEFSSAESKPYVSEERGEAGVTPKNNFYTFNIKPVGMRAVLRYWGSGQIGTDTMGRIFLHTPNGKEIEVGGWKPKDFNTVVARIKSYKELRENTCDISKYVTDPGEYKVEFRYTGGGLVLVILRVEIDVK